MQPNYKHYRYLFTIIFNVVLFYFLYLWLQKNIQFHALLHDMKRMSIFSIVVTMSLYGVLLVLYSVRFSLLLNIPYKQSMCIIGISNGINHILPFRLGDILRMYFARQFYDIEISRTLAATFMEKYYDLVILLLFGVILLFSRQYGLQGDAMYFFSTLLSCSVLSVVFYRYLIVKEGMIKSFVHRFKRIKPLLNAIEEITTSGNKLRVSGLTLLIWAMLLFIYYNFFKMNLGPPSFSMIGALFILFATTLMFAVPYTFGATGIFEASIVYYLIRFHHASPVAALALALVLHFATALPQVIVMLYFLIVNRIRWLRPIKALKTGLT